MKVRDILQIKGSQVHSIGPDQTVLEAVTVLMEHRIGALLVRDGTGAVVGVISERDVLSWGAPFREPGTDVADLWADDEV